MWCCPTGSTLDDVNFSCSTPSGSGKGNQTGITPPTQPLTSDTLDELNPLKNNSTVADELSDPGKIISRVLVFAFPIAGIILFVMLTWAGFEIVAGAGSKKAQDAGKQRATAALIGFILLFASYWIAQIVEAVFNVTIL